MRRRQRSKWRWSLEETQQSYPFELRSSLQVQTWGNGKELPGTKTSYEVDLKPLLKSIVHEVQAEEPFSKIGGKFHRTLARMIAEVSQIISGATGIRKVALSGGCFQNRLLLRMTVEELQKRMGFILCFITMSLRMTDAFRLARQPSVILR